VGKVIVAKNPCLHPGDIRLLTAISPNEIKLRCNGKNVLKPFINVLVFPQKGKCPITSQISGSDLDGDQFFVTWDPRLVDKIIDFAPMDYTPMASAQELQIVKQ